MNLFTPSLTGTEGSWIAEKKKIVRTPKAIAAELCKEFMPASNNSMTGLFTNASLNNAIL